MLYFGQVGSWWGVFAKVGSSWGENVIAPNFFNGVFYNRRLRLE